MGAQALNGKSSGLETYSKMGLINDYDRGVSGPPKILAIVSSVLEKSIQKNEKLLKASKEKDVITVFHGSRAPALSIRQYIDRIFKYTDCSPSCFVVAYMYLRRYLHQIDVRLTALNVHRLFITSFMLASKFVEDECYNNAYYAKVGGVTTAEINKLEMKFLETLDFRLHVTVEAFDNFCLQLEEEATGKLCIERPIKICGSRKDWPNQDGTNRAPTIAGYTCRAI